MRRNFVKSMKKKLELLNRIGEHQQAMDNLLIRFIYEEYQRNTYENLKKFEESETFREDDNDVETKTKG